ncbi:MAG TPA: hypothetical protein VIE16_05680 [Phenylobacterium sp.]|jgi:hypothetical protein
MTGTLDPARDVLLDLVAHLDFTATQVADLATAHPILTFQFLAAASVMLHRLGSHA